MKCGLYGIILLFIAIGSSSGSAGGFYDDNSNFFFLNIVVLSDTSIKFSWNYNSTFYRPFSFQIENSIGEFSEEFKYLKENITPNIAGNHNYYSANYTTSKLSPDTHYRFRIVPIMNTGRGETSEIISIRTPKSVFNYWEPITARRLSLSRIGQGFTNPVVQRPHLDLGVEVFNEFSSNNSVRYSDPTTSKTPKLPSGRRGHSLSTIEQSVYMFGGRTNGYSCASTYKETLNLGIQQSGRYVDSCSFSHLEVNELWEFDISTYTWTFLNTSQHLIPQSREQHNAIVLDGDLFIYGGKRRLFYSSTSIDGAEQNIFHADEVFGDLWRLRIQHSESFNLHWPNETQAIQSKSIPQNSILLLEMNGRANNTVKSESDGISPREGLCVDNIIVKLKIYHDCISQLKITLIGPGPLTGSPNFFTSGYTNEVLLIDDLPTNGSNKCVAGFHNFVFDDASEILPEVCCENLYNGTYKPEGKISEFIGSSMSSLWKLTVEDKKEDSFVGYVLHWELDFQSSPCFKTYQWENITTSHSSSFPKPRYKAMTIAYKNSFFLFGGRDQNDAQLTDLHRFDVQTNVWTVLNPINFDVALVSSSAVGSSYVLSTWGLLRYGGYYREKYMNSENDNYQNDNVFILNTITLRWERFDLVCWPYSDNAMQRKCPSARYLSAMTFIPSVAISSWKTQFYSKHLYDNSIDKSTKTNFIGTVVDSVLMFGGFDESTGALYDGSSSGFLNDLWMIRLANCSTEVSRYKQNIFIDENCAIFKNPIKTSSLKHNCLGNNLDSCDLKTLFLLSWCSKNNQSII